MSAHKPWKRVPIGGLQSTMHDISIVAVIIGKTEYRKVVSKSDGAVKYVCTLTLRDSPHDIVNYTVWMEREALELLSSFKIGNIIELINPRIIQRDFGSTRDNYQPSSTSQFNLMNVEGRTRIVEVNEDNYELQSIFYQPSKSSNYLNVMDILKCRQLVGRFVDLFVGVRSVGPVKSFLNKEGEERRVRDVKLFDETASCLVFKIWDENLIAMSDSWEPRVTILFLADVKVSFDEWRCSTFISSSSKTIITEEPVSDIVDSLRGYCQVANFSTSSRLDSIVANLVPETITQVHNVYSLNLEAESPVQDKDALLISNIYGYITRISDIDEHVPISLRCGYCSQLYKSDQELGFQCCQNMDCREYRSETPEKHAIKQFNIKLDITDETGTLIACNFRHEAVERYLGTKIDNFLKLSEVTRKDLKWELLMAPMRLTMAVLLPTLDKRSAVFTVIHAQETSLQEICAKMPNPVPI